MIDGSTFELNKDQLYDRNATDWEQFDRPRHYDDDDDKDDDDYDDFSDNKKDSLSDWFYRGIGFGLGNAIFGGGGSGGNGSGSETKIGLKRCNI